MASSGTTAAVSTAPSAKDLLRGNYLDAITIACQDTNGNHVYSNEKALYGYIEASDYLVLPESFANKVEAEAYDNNASMNLPYITVADYGSEDSIKLMLGEDGDGYRRDTQYVYYSERLEFLKIALLNYKALREGGMKDKTAFAVASLRARWCALGCWDVASRDKSRTISEVRVVGKDKPTNAPDIAGTSSPYTTEEQLARARNPEALFGVDISLARDYMALASDTTFGTAWVTGMADAIWIAEEFIVRVRGHHYKKEFEPNLIKFLSSYFEGKDRVPKDLDMAAIFRTSIHPFGLKALPIMAGHLAIHGKMANSALIRLSAAPNGIAVITTTAAAIRSLESEAWYNRFREAFGEQIDRLNSYEKQILENKFGFHQSHRLYGELPVLTLSHNGTSYTIDQAKESGRMMASIGQGFVDAMRQAVDAGAITGFAFSNSKAMEKHAQSNPLMTLRITALILNSLESISEAKGTDELLAAAIPKLKDEAQKSNAQLTN